VGKAAAPAAAGKEAVKFFEIVRVLSIDGKPPSIPSQDDLQAARNARAATKAPPDGANVTQPVAAPAAASKSAIVQKADGVQSVPMGTKGYQTGDRRETSHFSPSNEGGKQEVHPENQDADPVEDEFGAQFTDLDVPAPPGPSGIEPSNAELFGKGWR